MCAIAKRDNDLHVRVCDEAEAALDLMAAASGKPRNQIAAEIIERSLLGEAHALKLAAMKFARLGICGQDRD